MAYTYSIQNMGEIKIRTEYVTGLIVADATTIPTMDVTVTAGQYNNIVVSDNTPFLQNDVIQIDGAGTAGANLMTMITVIGQSDTTVNTARICVRQYRPAITAVGPVAVEPYYKVWTRFRPDRISLLNLTTLDRYEWFREMEENTAIKTTGSTGVVTSLVDSGIFPTMMGFTFHPSLLSESESMVFECWFPNGV